MPHIIFIVQIGQIRVTIVLTLRKFYALFKSLKNMSKKRGWIGKDRWSDYRFFMIFLAGFFLIFGGALLSSDNFKMMAIVWVIVGIVGAIGTQISVSSENKYYDEQENRLLRDENEELKKKLNKRKKKK